MSEFGSKNLYSRVRGHLPQIKKYQESYSENKIRWLNPSSAFGLAKSKAITIPGARINKLPAAQWSLI